MRHNIFAIELCIRFEPRSRLREQLRRAIVNHPAMSSPGQKWNLLKETCERLLEHQHEFEKGCWDFFDDDGRALRDYDMWSNGMITEEGARKEPSGPPSEGGTAVRYLTFTIALLLVADTECSRDLEDVCEIPEERLWERATFVRILKGLRRVNFAAVKSDIFYLIPGDEKWGLTAEDLEDPKFDYLRAIRS